MALYVFFKGFLGPVFWPPLLLITDSYMRNLILKLGGKMGKLIGFFIVGMVLLTGMASAETLIICHPGVQESTIPQHTLRKIFLGKTTRWDDHSKIHMVVLKDRDEHALFLKRYIRRTSSQWRSYWKKMVFTGKGIMPKSFDGAGDALEYIASTPGAIGYIDADLLNNTVKVLNIK